MELSKEEIKHIAKLARLDLTSKELETYGSQLSHILEYIDQLKEVDTNETEPTAQVTGLTNVWRDDKAEAWNDDERKAALDEAPSKDDDFLKVKRVIE
jgi:aspartyl-tRNA(Asn)/glutamyl-tRNA(Gln) amidotransferase subunit C